MKMKSAMLFIAVGATLLLAGCAKASSRSTGSQSEIVGNPIPINETHIFNGEYKSNGRVVGFHSRPGGVNPSNAEVTSITAGPNSAGVYTANVRICETSAKVKCGTKFSSFYPDSMSRQNVLNAIQYAYDHRTNSGQPFRGPSNAGFTIEGYTVGSGENLRINTAYPVYTN